MAKLCVTRRDGKTKVARGKVAADHIYVDDGISGAKFTWSLSLAANGLARLHGTNASLALALLGLR